MISFKLETWRDAQVVGLFHILGLLLEIYKVNQGSWVYPEFAYTKIWGAPLYSGFMHGSVASFMCLAWKRLNLRSTGWPPKIKTVPIAVILYIMFFLPSSTSVVRMYSLLIIPIVFFDCNVHYTIDRERYKMPMSLAFLLIGTMIYLAENLATYFGAWKYPYQLNSWQPVHATKIVSWSLLMIVSLIIIAEYKRTQFSRQTKNWGIPNEMPQ